MKAFNAFKRQKANYLTIINTPKLGFIRLHVIW